MHEEIYPSVIIAKRSKVISGLNYFEKVFYIDDYLYEQLYGNYDNNFTLYEDTFSRTKDALKMVMGGGDWQKLTYLMGSVAENQFGKCTYQKPFLMRHYKGYIITNIPDAVHDNKTVYEFKTVQYNLYIEKQFRIAELQSDLTAYLFGYKNIFIEVMDFNDLKIHTKKRKADLKYAKKVLDEVFNNYKNEKIDKSLIDGKRCKDCPYKNQCN